VEGLHAFGVHLLKDKYQISVIVCCVIVYVLQLISNAWIYHI
jgi:hypothetical protein